MTFATDQAALQAVGNDWLALVRDKMVETGGSSTDDTRLVACYYDPLNFAIRCKQDGLLNSTLCDQLMANFRTTWRDYYVPTTAANSPGVPFLYSKGLFLDYLVNGQTTSKTRLGSIYSTSGYVNNPSTYANYTEIHYARELAYSMEVLMNNYLVGNVTFAAISSKLATFKSNALTLLSNWQSGTATLTQFYIRPFMVALVIDALIHYHEYITVLSNADITAIKNVVNYIDFSGSNLWRSGDAHPSLKFTSVRLDNMDPNSPATSEQSGLVSQNQDPSNQDGPGTNVELMFLKARYWVYSQGFGTTYRDRADTALSNNYPHYDGSYVQLYGAYVGGHNLASLDAKNVNHQFWGWADAVKYRAAGEALNAGQSSSGASGAKYVPTGQGYYGGSVTVVAPSFTPANFFNGATNAMDMDGNDTTKILDASGVAITNGTKLKTWNSSVSTPSWVQATVGNQPTWNSSVSNSKGGVVSTGSPIVLPVSGTTAQGLAQGATKVSLFTVFKPGSFTANPFFLRLYDNTFSVNRFRAFLAGAQPSLEMAVGTTTGNTRTATSWNSGVVALTANVVHAVLYEWDVANSSCQIYVNTFTATMDSTVAPGTSIANTTSASQEIMTTTDGTFLRIVMFTGALCSDRPGLFAAAKTYYGITVY